MEKRNEQTAILDLMLRPAFLVRDGVILHANPAAAQFLLRPGMPIQPLILCGWEEYTVFQQGLLYLTLSLADRAVGTTVTDCPDGQIFLPDTESVMPQLQALSLASAELRDPLSGLLCATNGIFSQLDDPKLRTLAAQANRRLQQLQRIIGNMSDAADYAAGGSTALEYTRVDSFLSELLEKAAAVIESTGRQLQIKLPPESVHSLVNREKLERALMNMLSNALKFSPAQSPILVQLCRNGNRLQLQVSNHRCADGSTIPGNLHDRFLREPALEDPRYGIGLGMVLMRAAAAAHGGALLFDRPEEDMDRITLTLAIHQQKQTQLRSPLLPVDYAGEQDHLLLELSEVLPASLYEPKP